MNPALIRNSTVNITVAMKKILFPTFVPCINHRPARGAGAAANKKVREGGINSASRRSTRSMIVSASHFMALRWNSP